MGRGKRMALLICKTALLLVGCFCAVQINAEFHQRVCLQSRGCHCKGVNNAVLDKYLAYGGQRE